MIAGQNQMLMPVSSEPRQTTSNIGFLKKPTIQARIHGLDRHYYSLVLDWRKNDLEEQMLMNLHKKDWTSGLKIQRYEDQQKYSEKMLEEMARLSKEYSTRVKEEEGKTAEEVEVMNVGKIDVKRHLESDVQDLMASAILQSLGTMIDTVVF
jgi:26S proteasome regulatory subunit N11